MSTIAFTNFSNRNILITYVRMKVFDTSLFHVFFLFMEQYSLLTEVWKSILPFHFSTV